MTQKNVQQIAQKGVGGSEDDVFFKTWDRCLSCLGFDTPTSICALKLIGPMNRTHSILFFTTFSFIFLLAHANYPCIYGSSVVFCV